jgi:DNA-binding response OmpR family regulator
MISKRLPLTRRFGMEQRIQPRVLIVDDEPETCALIQKAVSAAGMEALALTNSAQAPRALAQNKFDLVFLDFHMPSPDGIELARELRQSGPNRTTPIVLVSDDQRPSALSVGFDAGASFFLYKPIEKDRVLKLVRAAQGMYERERRRVRRVPVRQRVTLKCGAEQIEGETIDMSVSGLLVKAQRTFPPGSHLQLCLHLSAGADPVARSGSVVRIVQGNQMGIDMQRLKPTEEDAVQEFLLPLILTGG